MRFTNEMVCMAVVVLRYCSNHSAGFSSSRIAIQRRAVVKIVLVIRFMTLLSEDCAGQSGARIMELSSSIPEAQKDNAVAFRRSIFSWDEALSVWLVYYPRVLYACRTTLAL